MKHPHLFISTGHSLDYSCIRCPSNPQPTSFFLSRLVTNQDISSLLRTVWDFLSLLPNVLHSRIRLQLTRLSVLGANGAATDLAQMLQLITSVTDTCVRIATQRAIHESKQLRRGVVAVASGSLRSSSPSSSVASTLQTSSSIVNDTKTSKATTARLPSTSCCMAPIEWSRIQSLNVSQIIKRWTELSNNQTADKDDTAATALAVACLQSVADLLNIVLLNRVVAALFTTHIDGASQLAADIEQFMKLTRLVEQKLLSISQTPVQFCLRSVEAAISIVTIMKEGDLATFIQLLETLESIVFEVPGSLVEHSEMFRRLFSLFVSRRRRATTDLLIRDFLQRCNERLERVREVY